MRRRPKAIHALVSRRASTRPELRGWRCSAWRALAWMAASAVSAAGLAQVPAAVHLQLEAPAGCPSRDAVVGAVGRLVRKAPAEPLRARARIERAPSGWTVTVAFENGQRSVSGDSCLAVSQALVVLLALAVDPDARSSVAAFPEDLPRSSAPAGPEPTPLTMPPSLAEPPRAVGSSGDRRAAEPSAPRRLPLGLSLLLFGEVGMLPKPSIGPVAAGRWEQDRFAAELSLGLLLPRWAHAPGAPVQTGGNISWLGAQLAGCWSPAKRSHSAGCLGVEAGELVGTGEGVAHPRTGRALWLAGAMSAVLRAPIGSQLSTEGRVGLAVPLFRPRFGLEGHGEPFFRPEAVSGRILLGIAWR